MQKNGKKTDSESSFFKDKVIIITGGSSGIGYMAAKLLLAEGARVIVASREGEHLQQAGRTLPGAIIIATDTSNEVSVRAMIEAVYARFARIDILVNNAGRAYGGLLEQLEVEQVDYLFRLHVLGPVASMQAVIPIMRKQGSGRIVNVSSPLAKRTIPGLAAYSLTKAALDRMTLISRKELKDDSIVVSIFYPYITATDIIKKGLDGLKASKDSFDWSHQQTNLPAPDSVKFAASRLVDALQSKKKTSNARSMSYIILGIIKNKLKF